MRLRREIPGVESAGRDPYLINQPAVVEWIIKVRLASNSKERGCRWRRPGEGLRAVQRAVNKDAHLAAIIDTRNMMPCIEGHDRVAIKAGVRPRGLPQIKSHLAV